MSSLLKIVVTFSCLFLFACGANTPKMDPQGDKFFDMPWPSDLRKSEDGKLDLDKFPARQFNPLGFSIIEQGIKTVNGFGTNSASYFAFHKGLNTTSLPTLTESLLNNSPVMLVNIDPASENYGKRIPVETSFNDKGTLFEQGNLLAILPRVGFTLEENVSYAAILFDGLKNTKDEPFEPSSLLVSLGNEWSEDLGLAEDEFNDLKAQKVVVDNYVNGNTDWSVDNVIAFSVFTTQYATNSTQQLAATIAAMPESEFVDSIESLSVVDTCYCQNCSDVARLRGVLALPRWQSGTSPYVLSGGGIEFTESGEAILNHRESVKFEINLSCMQTPEQGNPYNIDADGTGGYSGGSALRYLAGQPINLTTISVGAYQTGERVDPGLDDAIAFLTNLGIPLPDVELEGAIFYNYFNPLAAAYNKIQAASEFVYLKRVMENLVPIAQKMNISPGDLNLDDNAFTVDRSKAGIWGFSQGASSLPIALAMDDSFNFAVLDSPSSIAYPQTLYWTEIRELIEKILIGLLPNELDRFHPVVQMLQTFHEVGDSTNYAPYIETQNILITAGCYDYRVPRESAEALGIALARQGLLDVGNTLCASREFQEYNKPIVEGIELLNKDLINLPFAYANREDGGTGAFILSDDGHGTPLSSFIGGDFVYSIINDEVPTISEPRY